MKVGLTLMILSFGWMFYTLWPCVNIQTTETTDLSYDIHVRPYDKTVTVYGKISTFPISGPVNIRAIQFMDKESYKTILMNEEYSAEVSNIGPWQMDSYGDRLRLAYFDDRLNLMFTDWILFRVNP